MIVTICGKNVKIKLENSQVVGVDKATMSPYTFLSFGITYADQQSWCKQLFWTGSGITDELRNVQIQSAHGYNASIMTSSSLNIRI